MKVKEVVNVLRYVKELSIAYEGHAWRFQPEDTLLQEVLGQYEVSALTSLTPQVFEIEIASRPVKLP